MKHHANKYTANQHTYQKSPINNQSVTSIKRDQLLATYPHKKLNYELLKACHSGDIDAAQLVLKYIMPSIFEFNDKMWKNAKNKSLKIKSKKIKIETFDNAINAAKIKQHQDIVNVIEEALFIFNLQHDIVNFVLNNNMSYNKIIESRLWSTKIAHLINHDNHPHSDIITYGFSYIEKLLRTNNYKVISYLVNHPQLSIFNADILNEIIMYSKIDSSYDSSSFPFFDPFNIYISYESYVFLLTSPDLTTRATITPKVLTHLYEKLDFDQFCVFLEKIHPDDAQDVMQQHGEFLTETLLEEGRFLPSHLAMAMKSPEEQELYL